MIHHYVQRGHDWDKIASASYNTKIFLMASMELAAEEISKMFGGKGR